MPFPLIFPIPLGAYSGRSPLVRGPGTLNGRLNPANWANPEGDYALVLGSDEPGYTALLRNNERVDLVQTGTFPGSPVLRAKVRMRGASVIPFGWRWIFSCRVNGIVAWERALPNDVTLDVFDLATNLTHETGNSVTVMYSLTLVDDGLGEWNEVEIPAVYLDDLIFDDLAVSGGITIANRFPSNGQYQVDSNTEIDFDVLTNTGTNPDPAETKIYVDGVLIHDGSIAYTDPGWFVGTPLPPSDGVLRYNLTTGSFPSLATKTIRVVAGDGAGATIDETWSFTIEDLTAPRLESAIARDHSTVRIAWDEPVKQVDAEGSDDALNPNNYAIVIVSSPAATLTITSVLPVSPTEVDLIFDIPMTPGATYLVRASNVVDDFENVVDPAYDELTFVGYDCPQPARRRFEMWQMLSANDRRRDVSGELETFLTVLQDPLKLLLCDIDRWTDILDIDIAPERYVDQILIGLGNPFTRFDLSLEDKRRLGRVLVSMYRQKGTKPGIINVVRFFLGIEVDVTTYNSEGWILGEDELGVDTYLAPSSSWARYAFEVTSTIELTDDQRSQIRQIVDYMKPAHTHLVRIIEPSTPEVIDHLELGFSELDGEEWMLH